MENSRDFDAIVAVAERFGSNPNVRMYTHADKTFCLAPEFYREVFFGPSKTMQKDYDALLKQTHKDLQLGRAEQKEVLPNPKLRPSLQRLQEMCNHYHLLINKPAVVLDNHELDTKFRFLFLRHLMENKVTLP